MYILFCISWKNSFFMYLLTNVYSFFKIILQFIKQTRASLHELEVTSNIEYLSRKILRNRAISTKRTIISPFTKEYRVRITLSGIRIILGWHCGWWHWWHWPTTMSHMYKEIKKNYETERRKTFVTLWLANVTMSSTTMSLKCYPLIFGRY